VWAGRVRGQQERLRMILLSISSSILHARMIMAGLV